MGIVIGLIVERRCDCIREVEEEKKRYIIIPRYSISKKG